jgi:hypothetical protein
MLPAERKSFEQQVMSRRARLLRHAQRLRRRAGALSQPDPARGRDTHRRGRAAGPVRDGAGGGEGAGAFPHRRMAAAGLPAARRRHTSSVLPDPAYSAG